MRYTLLFVLLLLTRPLCAQEPHVPTRNDTFNLENANLYCDLISLLRLDTINPFKYRFSLCYDDDSETNRILTLKDKGYTYLYTDTAYDAPCHHTSVLIKVNLHTKSNFLETVNELQGYGLGSVMIMPKGCDFLSDSCDLIYMALESQQGLDEITVPILYNLGRKLYELGYSYYAEPLLRNCLSRGVRTDSIDLMLFDSHYYYTDDSMQSAHWEKGLLNPFIVKVHPDLYEKLADLYFRSAKISHYDTLATKTITTLDTGRLKKAIGYYNKAISEHPAKSSPYGRFALALYLNKDIDAARKYAKKGLELAPNNYLATYVLRFISGDFFIDPLTAD